MLLIVVQCHNAIGMLVLLNALATIPHPNSNIMIVAGADDFVRIELKTAHVRGMRFRDLRDWCSLREIPKGNICVTRCGGNNIAVDWVKGHIENRTLHE